MSRHNILFVQNTENPNIRVVNCRVELTDKAVENGARGAFNKELGEIGNLILHIRGVEAVQIRAYSVTIQKNPVFDWTEVIRDVTAVLGEVAKTYFMLDELDLQRAIDGEVHDQKPAARRRSRGS